MRVFEVAAAALLALGGIRSLTRWSRRRFEAVDVVDHALYALFITGRVGLWLAFAGFFAISASIDARGVPAVDELERYRWYLVVPMGLAAMQLVGGWFLGRRNPGAGSPHRPAPGGNGRGPSRRP